MKKENVLVTVVHGESYQQRLEYLIHITAQQVLTGFWGTVFGLGCESSQYIRDRVESKLAGKYNHDNPAASGLRFLRTANNLGEVESAVVELREVPCVMLINTDYSIRNREDLLRIIKAAGDNCKSITIDVSCLGTGVDIKSLHDNVEFVAIESVETLTATVKDSEGAVKLRPYVFK